MNEVAAAMLAAVVAVYGVYLYYKASGSLNPGKFNLITLVGALFFLQCFAGIVLITLGYDRHYTLTRLFNRDSSLQKTYWVIMIAALGLPLSMLMAERVLGIRAGRDYGAYLKKPTDFTDSGLLYGLTLGVCLLSLGVLFLFLRKIGYVPLFKMFFHEPDFQMDLERVRNAQIVVIHPYVTNLVIHTVIPVAAYLTFSCALTSRRPRWILLAAGMFLAALIAVTYNFAKAPLPNFVLIYLFILIYYTGGIRIRWVALFGGAALVFFLGVYSLMGAGVDLTDIYNGIWGRTLFTQVGTLSYNFDLFPGYMPFLAGRSFNRILLPLFGFAGDAQLRSGRLLMEVYGSRNVYGGTAGVMSSVFMGEAYANFGWPGVIFSVIWVGLVIGAMFSLCLRLRKTPASVTMFACFTVYMATVTQAGFVDFIYNMSWILIFAGLMAAHFLCIGKRQKEES